MYRQDPVIIYKSGEAPKPVWSVDLDVFLANGWSVEPVLESTPESVPPAPTETPVLEPVDGTKEVRRAELKALLSEDAGWQSIKEIANKLGIDKKPKGGWDEAIDLILAKEFEAE
jgi:hypothetical protein